MFIVTHVHWESGVEIGKQFICADWDKALDRGADLVCEINPHESKAVALEYLDEDGCYRSDGEWGVFISQPEN